MDWKGTIDEAMQLETEDIIAAHRKYEEGVNTALSQAQEQIEKAPEEIYNSLEMCCKYRDPQVVKDHQ